MILIDQPGGENPIKAGENISPEALDGRHEAWKFRLYVAGSAPNSEIARANLQQICEIIRQKEPDCPCSLEIVDILKEPQRALTDGILVTPTLLKLAPAPVCKLIGNLSEREWVLLALGL